MNSSTKFVRQINQRGLTSRLCSLSKESLLKSRNRVCSAAPYQSRRGRYFIGRAVCVEASSLRLAESILGPQGSRARGWDEGVEDDDDGG
mmetsp:Transcript_8877/g.12652  ORF Transcript_8877/g.12652 Transcript_8877/m.12652 type:complete len:90 (+) Transcript_8877:103-372(+)